MGFTTLTGTRIRSAGSNWGQPWHKKKPNKQKNTQQDFRKPTKLALNCDTSTGSEAPDQEVVLHYRPQEYSITDVMNQPNFTLVLCCECNDIWCQRNYRDFFTSYICSSLLNEWPLGFWVWTEGNICINAEFEGDNFKNRTMKFYVFLFSWRTELSQNSRAAPWRLTL